MLSLSESPIVFLLLVNIHAFIIRNGIRWNCCFNYIGSSFDAATCNISNRPVHFGVIITINLTIGLITPPVGTGLFIVSSVAKVKLERFNKGIVPFLIVIYYYVVHSHVLERCCYVASKLVI